jgi:hypothetical protein
MSCDSHADLRNINEFYLKPLPANNLKSSVIRAPIQFQQELNRLHVFNLAVTIPMEPREYEKLEGEMEAAGNSRVLLASEFDKVLTGNVCDLQSVKNTDILELIRPYLGPDEKVTIIWLNDAFFLLSFPSETTCRAVMEEWRESGDWREI